MKRKASWVSNYPSKARLLGYAGALAARGIGYYARQRAKAYASRPWSAPKETSNVITNQYQYKSVYRKRRARRVPRRAKYIARKVKGVLYKQLGANQFVCHKNFTITAAANAQGVSGMTFLGYSGNNAAQHNDVFRCFDNFYQAGTSTVASAKFQSARLVFQTAVVDFAFRNSSNTATVDLDVYTLVCRKDIPIGVTGPNQILDSMFTQTLLEIPNTLQSGLGPVASGTLGVTPFQSPQFVEYWKVLNKKKFILSPGQAANYQYRSKKTKYVNGSDLITGTATTANLFAKKYITMGFLFIINGIVTAGAIPACSIDWSSTKTFNVKLLQSNVDTLDSIN